MERRNGHPRCPLKRATKDACSNVVVRNGAECKDYYAEKEEFRYYACRARRGAREFMESTGKCKMDTSEAARCDGPVSEDNLVLGTGFLYTSERSEERRKDPNNKFRCADLKKGDILVLNFDGGAPIKYKHAVTVLGFTWAEQKVDFDEDIPGQFTNCANWVKDHGVKSLHETAGYKHPISGSMGRIAPFACVFSATASGAATISTYSCDPDIRPRVPGVSWSNDNVASVLQYTTYKGYMRRGLHEQVIRDVARVAEVWYNGVSDEAKRGRSFTKTGATKSAVMSGCLGDNFAPLQPYRDAASAVLNDIGVDGKVSGAMIADYWPKRDGRPINMFCSKLVAAVWGGVLMHHGLERDGPAKPEACLPGTLRGLSTMAGGSRLHGKWHMFEISGWWA